MSLSVIISLPNASSSRRRLMHVIYMLVFFIFNRLSHVRNVAVFSNIPIDTQLVPRLDHA